MLKTTKTLLKEIKDLSEWKDIPCSWVARLNIVKVAVILKAIYRFNTVSIKTPTTLFAEMEKPIFKFV